jgi:hypothetical protein
MEHALHAMMAINYKMGLATKQTSTNLPRLIHSVHNGAKVALAWSVPPKVIETVKESVSKSIPIVPHFRRSMEIA